MFSRPVYTLPNRSHFSSSCCVVQNTFLLALKQPRFVRRFHLMAESGEILLDKVFHRLLFFFLATVAVQRSVSAAPPHKAAPLWRKITLISSFCLLHASCRQPEESSMRLRQALGVYFSQKIATAHMHIYIFPHCILTRQMYMKPLWHLKPNFGPTYAQDDNE